jgi:hypothetical protein
MDSGLRHEAYPGMTAGLNIQELCVRRSAEAEKAEQPCDDQPGARHRHGGS